tara:strand:- start:17407 stop:18432 length:1026 start_codon:yes stop_codon:yes gene_type:complete
MIKEDSMEASHQNQFIMNLPMYINLPLILLLVFMTVFVISSNPSVELAQRLKTIIGVDLMALNRSMHPLDTISLVALTSLFIGIMGTVPGHELVHRIKNKFDMFMGNWLLAFSWDCAFAIEHVYGHHKNVGLESDPATAKRGENLYRFILRAIIKEQKDAWIIENNRLRNTHHSIFSIKNRMLIGHIRSGSIAFIAYLVGGLNGMLIFILCAFIAKCLLEVINYTEHYGLVRVPGQPVKPHHSWNTNSAISSMYLYNVTRHSSHHEKSHLKYWKLKSYPNAPTMPQGYLSMLYLAIFLPWLYHKIMAPRLIDWDRNYASKEEQKIAQFHNQSGNIHVLQNK